MRKNAINKITIYMQNITKYIANITQWWYNRLVEYEIDRVKFVTRLKGAFYGTYAFF